MVHKKYISRKSLLLNFKEFERITDNPKINSVKKLRKVYNNFKIKALKG